MNAKTQAGPTRGIIVSRQVRARVLTWGPGPLLMWFPDGEQWDRGRLPDISLHRNRGIIDRKVVAQGKLLGVVRTIDPGNSRGQKTRASRTRKSEIFLPFLSRSTPRRPPLPSAVFVLYFSWPCKKVFIQTRVHPRSSCKRSILREWGRNKDSIQGNGSSNWVN